MSRAILMCAGEYEPIPIPVGKKHKSLRSAEAFVFCGEDPLVIAVDGGLPRLLEQGIMPDLVLGDFDSLEEKYRPALDEFDAAHPGCLLRLPCEKDDTDTVYAARMCLERGCREILFYGALGGRLDHTVANLQTLSWLKEEGADGYLIGKTTLAAVIGSETVMLPAGYEGTFSFFALDREVAGVTLKGMKYPLSEAVVTNSFPVGVSNEVNADTVRGTALGRASVTVREGLALMILEKSESEIIRREKKRAGENGSLSGKNGKNGPVQGAAVQGMPDPSEFERIPL